MGCPKKEKEEKISRWRDNLQKGKTGLLSRWTMEGWDEQYWYLFVDMGFEDMGNPCFSLNDLYIKLFFSIDMHENGVLRGFITLVPLWNFIMRHSTPRILLPSCLLAQRHSQLRIGPITVVCLHQPTSRGLNLVKNRERDKDIVCVHYYLQLKNQIWLNWLSEVDIFLKGKG